MGQWYNTRTMNNRGAPRHPDVVVIGGGPAGASAAIRLARSGRRVRLYEKKRFPRAKLCGGFLSSDGIADLQELGVYGALLKTGVSPVRRTVIASKRGTILESPLHQEALSISREAMDGLLLDTARDSGVDVCEAQDGFLQGDESAYQVIAAGRQVPRGPGSVPLHPWYASPSTRYFGLQATFENVEGVTDQVELDLIDSGYVGLARQGANHVNVCALTTQDTVERYGPSLEGVLAHFASENPVLRRHLATARRTTSWMAVGPVQLGIRQLAVDRTFYVGDAACVIDPFAGEGMSIALYSSKLLVAALDQTQTTPARAYEWLWRQAFLPSLRWNAAARLFYAMTLLREPIIRTLRIYPTGVSWLTDMTRHRQLNLA